MIPQIQPYLTGTEATEIAEYVASGAWMTEFKKTKELEDTLAELLGVKHCIMTTSGTAALSLACMAMSCKAYMPYRAKVLVSDFTMIASAHAVDLANCFTNLKVELIDIDPKTLCMDTNRIKEITEDTVGVIYTEINGRCGDIYALKEFCHERGWFLIEDACQSLFSKHEHKYLGTIGDIGCFSLSPQKIITSGQGGVVVTNSDTLYTRIKQLKDHGRVTPGIDSFNAPGFNFKYTDLQAVIALEQLKTIDMRIEKKKATYKQFYDNLKSCTSVCMIENSNEETPWYNDIFIENRDELAKILKDHSIETKAVYPPLHNQFPFNGKNQNINTKIISNTGLWLPSSINLSSEDINYICNIIKGAYKE